MSSAINTRPPTFKQMSYAELVRKAWGNEWLKRETVYQFSNNRKFEDSGPNGGFYSTNTST